MATESSHPPIIADPSIGRMDAACYIGAFLLLLGIPAIVTLSDPYPNYLGGVEHTEEFPKLNLESFLKGDVQREFERWYDQVFFLRLPMVRTTNQIDYSFFSEISFKESSQLVLGKEKHLFEIPHIESYYGKDILSERELDSFAARLRGLQDHLNGQGIRFLFFITPSKATIYPEFIPDRMAANRSTCTNYQLVIPLLRKHEVQTFDGQYFMTRLKKESRIPLFPQGGTHWNHYSSFRTTQELISRMQNILGRRIARLELEGVFFEENDRDSNSDLARLANLWDASDFVSQNPYPVVRTSVPPEATRPKVLLVGGSFLELPHYWLMSNRVIHEESALDLYFRRGRDKIDALRHTINQFHLLILETNVAAFRRLGFGLLEAVSW